MMSISKRETIFVGVDVSKGTLDIYRPDSNESARIDNSEQAVQKFCLTLQTLKRSVMVVMEAT